jgi:hypothetical protein
MNPSSSYSMLSAPRETLETPRASEIGQIPRDKKYERIYRSRSNLLCSLRR